MKRGIASGKLRAGIGAFESWQEYARCAQTDPEAFFPNKGDSGTAAKRVCADCPVQQQCLEYALANDERIGIWGGTTPNDRRRIRRTYETEQEPSA